jgi:hypothetical protein
MVIILPMIYLTKIYLKLGREGEIRDEKRGDWK